MRIWEQTIYWLNQNSGYLLEKRNETIKEEFQENILLFLNIFTTIVSDWFVSYLSHQFLQPYQL